MTLLVPAIKSHMGDWEYFLGSMRMPSIAKEFHFFHELSDTDDVAQLLQRGVSSRADEIKEYLLESKHRFFGSIIVAAWGGDPKFIPVKMDAADKGNLSDDIDERFGVLKFDGTQRFFALDGQHRLAAIKDAVAEEPNQFVNDFVSVLLVRHDDTKAGMGRTRRLFTNVNKNARKTTAGEDIVLDEDDGNSIVTRRLIKEHPFFGKKSRVKIFGRPPSNGRFTIAGKSISPNDEESITTIVLLKEMVTRLSDWQGRLPNNAPPSNADAERVFSEVSESLTNLFKATGDLHGRVLSGENVKILRSGDGEGKFHGHAMMRPVVQTAVVTVISDILRDSSNGLTWRKILSALSDLDWKIDAPLWSCVYNEETGKMISGKDFSQLLMKMLHAHIAPSSMAAVKDAIQDYELVMQKKWQGASANALAQKIVETA